MDEKPVVRTFQTCDASRKRFRFKIPSRSTPGLEYEIEGSFTEGKVECSCPGFRFKGTCGHTDLKEERCGWNSLESPEAQTRQQRDAHICPRCGSTTMDVLRGDFREEGTGL